MRVGMVAVFVGLVGCGESGMSEMEGMTMDCTGAQEFRLGLTVSTDAGLDVTLESAVPAPIDVGDNQWTLAIANADGSAATGLEPRVRPFMPLHGHGVSPETYAGTETSDGVYEIETFDLIMPGLWNLHVELPSGDAAMFSLCAEG